MNMGGPCNSFPYAAAHTVVLRFREDLKGMYKIAGMKEEGVMFLFTDSQITNGEVSPFF